jgi:hypothetical protein
MFEKCANCTTRVVMGKKDANGIFCSAVCQNFYRFPGFCKSCSTSTSSDSAGSTFTVNGIGTNIYGGKDPCPECGSTIQTKWFVVFFIPLIPIGKYRTKWCSPGRYLSRKVLKNPVRQTVSGSTNFTSTMGR